MLKSGSDSSAGALFTLRESQDFFLGPFRFESELDLPELRDVSGPGTIAVSHPGGGCPASPRGRNCGRRVLSGNPPARSCSTFPTWPVSSRRMGTR